LAAERAAKGDFTVTRATARYLALWMAYEDVIRVAQIKTRMGRIERVRQGAGGKSEQPVIVTEFLKPGLDEFCSIMPAFIAGPITRWAERTGRRDSFNVGLHIRTSTVFGFVMLRTLARLCVVCGDVASHGAVEPLAPRRLPLRRRAEAD